MDKFVKHFKGVRRTFLLSTLLLVSSPIHAALTPVASPNGSEPNLINNSFQLSVMNALYGAGNYTRINDSSDRVWSATNGSIDAVAKFAGNGQKLGYFSGSSGTVDGSTFNLLFSVVGSGYGVSGSASGLNLANFRWGLKTGPAQGTQYFGSNPIDNTLDSPAYNDHMVTFLITGTAGGYVSNPLGAYVIAFEDRINNKHLSSDRDFNDAVFEVHNTVPVPEPSTYLTLLTTLGLGMYMTRKYRGEAKQSA